MHDPRIGRFFAPDPLEGQYPNYSPYSFSGNRVINSLEREGLEETFYMLGKKNINGTSYLEFINVLEISNQLELITGHKIKTWNNDNAYVYGTDGHWHKLSNKVRNSSLYDFGNNDKEIFDYLNNLPVADKQYNMASNIKALEKIGNTASAAISLVYLGKSFKDIKGLKSIIKSAQKTSLRDGYTNAVAFLKNVGEKMLKAGKSEKEVAMSLNTQRRTLGELFKDATPAELRDFIYKFNEKRYGDKLGPTYEMLKKAGKTDAQIIDGASRPLGDSKALGQALYKEFGDEIKPILKKYDMLD